MGGRAGGLVIIWDRGDFVWGLLPTKTSGDCVRGLFPGLCSGGSRIIRTMGFCPINVINTLVGRAFRPDTCAALGACLGNEIRTHKYVMLTRIEHITSIS